MSRYARAYNCITCADTQREVFRIRVQELIREVAPYSVTTSYGQRDDDALRAIAGALSGGKHYQVKAIRAKIIDASQPGTVSPSKTDLFGVGMLRILHHLGVSLIDLEFDSCGFITHVPFYDPSKRQRFADAAEQVFNTARRNAGLQAEQATQVTPSLVMPNTVNAMIEQELISMQSLSMLMGLGVNSARGSITRKLRGTRNPTYADAGAYQLLTIALTAGLDPDSMVFNLQGDIVDLNVRRHPQVTRAVRAGFDGAGPATAHQCANGE